MLVFDNIKVEFESQGFRCSHIGFSPEKDKAVIHTKNPATREIESSDCGTLQCVLIPDLAEQQDDYKPLPNMAFIVASPYLSTI